MAPRRKSKPVTLTDAKRAQLENLWFLWGNYGPKSTPGNHSFIQAILEHGIDIRPLLTRRSRKSEIPTPECEAAVDRILNADDAALVAQTHERLLRLVKPAAPQRPKLKLDPEVTAMLDEMKSRQQPRRETFDPRTDTPDAA